MLHFSTLGRKAVFLYQAAAQPPLLPWLALGSLSLVHLCTLL